MMSSLMKYDLRTLSVSPENRGLKLIVTVCRMVDTAITLSVSPENRGLKLELFLRLIA